MIKMPILKMLKTKGDFIHPLYGRYSVAEIGPTILRLFGLKTKRSGLPFLKDQIGQYRQVILVLADGFGYNHFQQYRKIFPFLKQLAAAGKVYPLTSVFPSTTGAALTAVHTGLSPQEHGIPEWTVYFEELDAVIETLPFRPVKTDGLDTMLKAGGKPQMLFSGRTLYQQLKAGGVKSFVFTPQAYAHSVYSRLTQRGSQLVTFRTARELCQKLRATLKRTKGRAYFFVYWPEIDSAEHRFGPGSPEHKKALGQFFSTLQKELVKKIDVKVFSDTLLILSSDHGQVKVNPKKTIYLNHYPQILNHLAKTKSGQLIPPTGSPRDVFLHVQPAKIKQTVSRLKKLLGNKAKVVLTADLIKQGWFGLNQMTPQFKRRIGNIMILARQNYLVWYIHVPGKPFVHQGIHGGATKKEMLVPLAFLPLSKF